MCVLDWVEQAVLCSVVSIPVCCCVTLAVETVLGDLEHGEEGYVCLVCTT